MVRQQLQALLEARAVPAFWAAMGRCRSAAAAGDDEALEEHLLCGLQGLVAVVDSHCAALQSLAGSACASPSPAAAAAAAEQARALAPQLAGLAGSYRGAVSALLLATADISVSELLLLYYSSKLTQLAETLAPVERLLEAQEEGGPDGPGCTAAGDGSLGGASGGLLGTVAGGGGGFGGLGLAGPGSGPGRMSDGGGGGVGSAAVEGVAMLKEAAGDENTPPPSTRRGGALAPSAVARAMGGGWVGRLVCVSACLARLALGRAGEEAVVAAVAAHVEGLLRRLALGVFQREVLPAASRAAGRIPLEFLRLVIAGDGAAGGGGGGAATPASTTAAARGPATFATSTATLSPAGASPSFNPTAAATTATPTANDPPTAVVTPATAGLNLTGGLAEPGTEGRTLSEWRLRLSYLVFETLGRLRISQMFDIVVDYPDSLPAIRDLAACLRHTNLQSLFVASFQAALRRRLLHAGASATAIIHQYVATIRTMRELDPSGALLHAVAQPIRDYLRGRSDTTRCLVGLVTQDAGNPTGESLLEEQQREAQEAGRAAAAPMDVDAAAEDADERVLRIATATAAAGFPGVASQAPTSAGGAAAGGGAAARASTAGGGGGAAGLLGGAGSAADVVSMLTGVFGSPEVFIAEYRNLLSGQLLYRTDYETAREVRTLELLKMRFGENAMHACEVMLKDVADSKRINTRIHATPTPVPGGFRPQSPTSAAAAAAAAVSAAAVAAAAGAARAGAAAPSLPPRPGGGGTPSNAGRGSRQQQAQPTPPQRSTPPPQVQTRAAAAAAAALAAAAAAQTPLAAGAPPPSTEGADAPTPELALLSATVLSYLFWPNQEDRDKGAPDDPACGLLLPPGIREAMEAYGARYHHLKTPRKLRWRPALGAVELDVSAGGVTASFTVSPLQATLLMAFKDRPAMTAAELAAEVGLPAALVRRKMLFWVNHGVILEGRAGGPGGGGGGAAASGGGAGGSEGGGGGAGAGRRSSSGGAGARVSTGGGAAAAAAAAGGDLVYRRAEVLPAELKGASLTDAGAEDEAPAQLPSAADRAVEEVGPYENYIKGMLQNYGGLPLDRLNQLLRLFVVSTPKYDKTPEQLQAFLQVLIARGTVVLDNNSVYRLASGPGAK
ncbi:hypothetical protein HYH03_013636 [Edaphochlamys debaryana]|uniref:Anaphase-promoting complex subunit 2 n=1 Tax=Edaphochlamys debaryana TaxID=47281 RepID=A0A835XQP1_9CHLO|nr:hypothetical protein HYH03_013636 [Edaphochlamys debaryana]|eukprot:KAG2487792.1 hypothetical protein HYH03_013636 [Edaphochlamys debaryana]